MVDRVGQQFGNYRLVSLLGQGGYAEVYLGQHIRFKQRAAIKILHAHLSEQEVEHFQQEAETIATLAHPSIIRVLDFDVQDGVPFLVMDYAPNGSLRRRYPKGSLVPLPVIISSVKQVAEALQYAHEQKFIHRDVKPENMLVGKRQEILLSDFGIATIVHSTSSLNASAEGTSGTLAYMAPEQIEGHPRPASDQYALGVVVYEWLCGERPFEGSVSELIAQQLSMPPLSLRERMPAIPAEVEQVVLRVLAKDPKARFASVADFATALEQASQRALAPTAQQALEQSAPSAAAATSYETVAMAPSHPVVPTEATPSADLPVGVPEPTVYPGAAPNGHDTSPRGATSETPQRGPLVAPTAAAVSPPLERSMPVERKARRVSRTRSGVLIGLTVLVVAGGILSSLSLLAHFGVFGAHSSSSTPTVVRGGTWTYSLDGDVVSLIPNGTPFTIPGALEMDQALYLPLFYGDAQGIIQAGAATEVPTVQNGGISADATTWTFHLRPGLVWSDGQPYDARDVDFTWKLWTNPKFGAVLTQGLRLINGVAVSADHLSITFRLKRPYVPFASLWMDGAFAPLPAHHFSTMAPEAIVNSPDNLNPRVTSGPFMMEESVPGKHYTVVRNPRYYRASEGLPYLDKVDFVVADSYDQSLNWQLAGLLDAGGLWMDTRNYQAFQHLKDYRYFTVPQSTFEALYFNFHNTVLASHPEVRAAMAMAVDQQTITASALQGFGTPLCTDHPSAFHPGFEQAAPCPVFDLATANRMLDENGWVKGSDGVRTKDGQRLEFEYSTATDFEYWRTDIQPIIQRDFQQIGIKLDIQNYSSFAFYGSFLPAGERASPPTGAMAGRYDIVEFNFALSYDPDDSVLFACNNFPPLGYNIFFYCNPALDKLFAQEQATLDPGVRQQLFEQIHRIYLTQFPFIVLYDQVYFALVYKRNHNYEPGPFGDTYNIWKWWCDNGKCSPGVR
jgi:ABC-type transport system substrate-binding protein/serine/threonine protein kinase